MLLYAITGRRLLTGNEADRQAALVRLTRAWASEGVDYIQIREKDLPPGDLASLARRIVVAVHEAAVRAEAVREAGRATRVLLNGPLELALETGADGVHLTGTAPAGAEGAVRRAYRQAGREAIVSRACHSVEEVRAARDASLIVFAPVFEKVDSADGREGVGLSALAQACRSAGEVPVIALGGVTPENAADCIAAGAAGVAGIRLFLGDVWRKLR